MENRNLKTIQILLFLLSLSASLSVRAQNGIELAGIVRGAQGVRLELVAVSPENYPGGTISDATGRFSFTMPERDTIRLVFSRLGYLPLTKTIIVAEHADPKRIFLQISLQESIENMEEVVVSVDRVRGSNLTRIDPRITMILPDASGSFEGLIKKQMGVSSGNELSSQYSVRGGNFDENLVYVNDIQVYRPFLIRAGQQEGLSFVNPDMVSSVLFSAGGFDARYGDKMSSVLDIRYKKPVARAGSFSLGLLGGSLHLEGASKDRRLSHITGIRYKTNKFLLNTLDTKGDYNPRFLDAQTYISYDLTTEWEFDFLGNVAINNYRFIPDYGETSFGTINEAIKFKVFFEGMEEDAFNTYFGALTSRYHPHDHFELKFIVSGFQTLEFETYDILGQYLLNELDKDLGSDNFADSIASIGVGSFLDHARNRLRANVLHGSHKGWWSNENHQVNWGLDYRHSQIEDQIQEWIMMDSAGYSLPYSDTAVNLYYTYFAGTELTHNQVEGYLQENYRTQIADHGELTLVAGIRATWMDINQEFLLSPRTSVSYKPDQSSWLFRFSGGLYHQPPFFKEFRNLQGSFNTSVRAQKSAHILAGADYYFQVWNRPFKYTAELYFKRLWDLIPYEIDNVRIRYYGDNLSHGYAAGLDMKIAGEFVPGVDSWASISVMKTQEDIMGDTLGYIDRPTDQRVNLALFFQDYLPNNQSYKAHLNLLFGTGLPYGPPGIQETKDALRIPPYRRVDLGFSKILIGEEGISSLPGPLKYLKSTWLSLEFFNLLDINNTMSHIWIRDIRGKQYSIPNYLTGRRINLKLQARF